MKISDINRLLQHYNKNRGWFRYFFGNTQGMKHLQHFYAQLDTSDRSRSLTLEELNTLEKLLADRSNRLHNREDDYLTPQGLNKLTNNIYYQLAGHLARSYQAHNHTPQNCLLMPRIINASDHNNKPMDTTELKYWHVFEESGKHYALNIKSYGQDMTIENAWQNPYTQNPLPQSSQQFLTEQSIFKTFYQQAKLFLEQISRHLWRQHPLDSTWKMTELKQTAEEVIYHAPTAQNHLTHNLVTLTYDTFQNSQEVYQDLLLQYPVKYYKETAIFEQLQTKALAIQTFPERTQIAMIKDRVLTDLFVDKTNRVIVPVSQFLETFFLENGKICHPIDNQPLSYAAFRRLHTYIAKLITDDEEISLLQEDFLQNIAKLQLDKQTQKYKNYLRIYNLKNQSNYNGTTDLYSTPDNQLFVTESEHCFDIVELYHNWQVGQGFYNPHDDSQFTATDIENLNSMHKIFGYLQKITNALPEGCWSGHAYHPEWLLKDMAIASSGICIHEPTAKLQLLANLPSINYQQYSKDKAFYQLLLNSNTKELLTPEEREAIEAMQLSMLELELTSIESPDALPESVAALPYKEVFVSKEQKRAFSISAFIQAFKDSGDKKLLLPSHNRGLPHSELILLVNTIKQLMPDIHPDAQDVLGFIEHHHYLTDIPNYRLFNIVQTLNNETTLDGKLQLKNVPVSKFVVTHDRYGFDAEELAAGFTYKHGFINPLSHAPLTEKDLAALTSKDSSKYHVYYAQQFMKKVASALYQPFPTEYFDTPISELLLTASGGVIPVLHYMADPTNISTWLDPKTQQPFDFETFEYVAQRALYLTPTKFLSFFDGDNSRSWAMRYFYQEYLLKFHNLKRADRTAVFITESGDCFEVEAWLTSAKAGLEFTNPNNGQKLSETDLLTLSTFPEYRAAVKLIKENNEKWMALSPQPTFDESPFLLSIAFYDDSHYLLLAQPANDLFYQIITLYRDDKIERANFFSLLEEVDFSAVNLSNDQLSMLCYVLKYKEYGHFLHDLTDISSKMITILEHLLCQSNSIETEYTYHHQDKFQIRPKFHHDFNKYYLPKPQNTEVWPQYLAAINNSITKCLIVALKSGQTFEFLQELYPTEVTFERDEVNGILKPAQIDILPILNRLFAWANKHDPSLHLEFPLDLLHSKPKYQSTWDDSDSDDTTYVADKSPSANLGLFSPASSPQTTTIETEISYPSLYTQSTGF